MKFLKLLFELYQLKRNTQKTATQIKRLQKEKLQNILKYAYDHSAYYHKTFEEVGINSDNIHTKDITDFPILDKKALIENFNELITTEEITQDDLRIFDETTSLENNKYKDKYHTIHSSGSTGKPAYFLYDDKAWNTMTLGIIRAALWDMSLWQIIKLIISKPRVLYIAATDGRYGGAMAVGDGVNALKMEQMHLNVQRPINEWIDTVESFKPDIIIGYPSAIKILAELMQEGKFKLSIKRVITCGEPLHQALQELFKSTFKCEIINIYGASESLAIGVGTTQEEGITLFDDLNYIEIYEEEIYLTCLYNEIQPLIRYKLSDKLNIYHDSVKKDPFLKVDILLSRNEDILWFEDEKGDKEFIHPLAVEGICVEGLLDYQFQKVNKNTFQMFAEVAIDVDQEIVKEKVISCVEKILDEKKLFYVKFHVKFVDYIKPDKFTGKKKLILD